MTFMQVHPIFSTIAAFRAVLVVGLVVRKVGFTPRARRQAYKRKSSRPIFRISAETLAFSMGESPAGKMSGVIPCRVVIVCIPEKLGV